jgi:hypothetical protein
MSGIQDDHPSLVGLDSDWGMVERALPSGWQEKAWEMGAISRRS